MDMMQALLQAATMHWPSARLLIPIIISGSSTISWRWTRSWSGSPSKSLLTLATISRSCTNHQLEMDQVMEWFSK